MIKKIIFYAFIVTFSPTAIVKASAANTKPATKSSSSALLQKRTTGKPPLFTHTGGPVKAHPLMNTHSKNEKDFAANKDPLEILRAQMKSRADQRKKDKTVVPGPSTPGSSAISSNGTTPLASPLPLKALTTSQESPHTDSPSLIAALKNSQSKPPTPRHSPRDK